MYKTYRWRLCFVGVAAVLAAASADGQSATQTDATKPAATPTAQAPEPIYWRQNLFLIPYQWSSTTDPSSAEAVWLYVSKDRGANWQKISEARPQVRAFNYHAEADGEFWFAIRTIDTRGRSWPDAPMQAELKVIVDTTIPRFGDLSGAIHDGDTLDIHWQVADANLDGSSCKLEVQPDGAGPWQAVPQPNSAPIRDGIVEGTANWHLPAACRTAAVRATAYDRAGNRAVSQNSIGLNSAGPSPTRSAAEENQWPTLISGRGDGATSRLTNTPTQAEVTKSTSTQVNDSSGWVSDSAPPTAAPREDRVAASQPWPANNSSRALPPATASNSNRVSGTEVAFGKPSGPIEAARRASIASDPSLPRPTFTPLEPFREAAGSARSPSIASGQIQIEAPSTTSTTGAAPKWVNSRTFALEYQLENIGERGVSKVELWGTRDNGQTWRSYAIDDDNRSPLQVTVDDEGMYGFRIVVEAAGGAGGMTPHPGDRPELWVGVDMHRPKVALTAASAGSGDLAGQLILRWQADDEHLEPRPIGLFYSSRPTGPWSTIATSLENTGEYGWQVARCVPSRIYLRIEARDLAGNLAAFQTSEPVTIDLPQPIGRPGAVEPLGPTASAPPADYH